MLQKDAQVLNFQSNLQFPRIAVNVLEIKGLLWSLVFNTLPGMSIKKKKITPLPPPKSTGLPGTTATNLARC